ncbi:MAG TPA: hypothetical protein VK206_16370 [Anaerolineales bacterium]|nr:hypothetical protein [Anaerolineales bacterium]
MGRFKVIWEKLSKWFSIPWYPIVLSAYPVLALLAANAGQVKLEAGWRSLLVCVGFVSLLFVLLRWLFHDWNRAAFLVTLWMVLFFSYGHIYLLLTEKFSDIDFTPWLLVVWLLLMVAAVFWARWKSPSPGALNLIALGLVITSLSQLEPGLGSRGGYARHFAAQRAPLQNLTRPQNPPDVYYFILDMYTRQDLLKSAYNYDNSSFVNALEQRGFYVAQCSQSNYTRTEISVASSLNLAYLQDLDDKFTNQDSTGRSHLWDTLKHNTVRYQLESTGYKTISFANGFPWSELDDADVFLTPPPFSSGVTEFETLFIQTTLARTLQDFGWLDLDQISGQNYRDRDMLVFNSMKSIANLQGPKFVYTHLILPHPPFVWGPDGKYTNPADFWNAKKLYPADKFKVGYTNQLTFLNGKLLETIDTILAESKTPPVIILQGDHGPWLQPNPQHFFILNAYYLPGHEKELYPTISPVNSFRLVFNDYFGGKYDMLKDKTYFSPVPKLYKFSDVPYPCN